MVAAREFFLGGQGAKWKLVPSILMDRRLVVSPLTVTQHVE